MIQKVIKLSTVECVKSFVSAIADFDHVVDLKSGRYFVNGKSIMGIFSLDLSQPIELEANGPSEQDEAFMEAIKQFEV